MTENTYLMCAKKAFKYNQSILNTVVFLVINNVDAYITLDCIFILSILNYFIVTISNMFEMNDMYGLCENTQLHI
jgi:hypothetical protein